MDNEYTELNQLKDDVRINLLNKRTSLECGLYDNELKPFQALMETFSHKKIVGGGIHSIYVAVMHCELRQMSQRNLIKLSKAASRHGTLSQQEYFSRLLTAKEKELSFPNPDDPVEVDREVNQLFKIGSKITKKE